MREQNRYVWACDKCLKASCWSWQFPCLEAYEAGLVVLSRKEAVALGREHTDWIDDPNVTATRKDYQQYRDARVKALKAIEESAGEVRG